MPRITALEKEAAPECAAIYDAVQKLRGSVPTMFKVLAHRPRLLETMLAHYKAVMAESSVTLRLKELVAVRVSAMNGCDY